MVRNMFFILVCSSYRGGYFKLLEADSVTMFPLQWQLYDRCLCLVSLNYCSIYVGINIAMQVYTRCVHKHWPVDFCPLMVLIYENRSLPPVHCIMIQKHVYEIPVSNINSFVTDSNVVQNTQWQSRRLMTSGTLQRSNFCSLVPGQLMKPKTIQIKLGVIYNKHEH
jgi:hypothetical protein